MEATGIPVLLTLPLSGPTADSLGSPGNLQKTLDITGNNAIGPSELFSSFLSQLNLVQAPTAVDANGVVPVPAPTTAAAVLPLAGNLLPPPIQAISIDSESQSPDSDPVAAVKEVLGDNLEQAELQPQLAIPALAVNPVAPLPEANKPAVAAVAATPIVTTLLANSVLAKPQTASHPATANTNIEDEILIQNTTVAREPSTTVVTATREIPVELVVKTDSQPINQPVIPSIAADGSNSYAPVTMATTQTGQATTTAPSSFTLNHPVTDAKWGDALGQRVIWMTDNGMGRAEIRLNPPELGPLNVSVTVANDEAKVAFNVQHGTTRELVEAALPRLREMFAAQGLELTDATVSQHTPDDRRHAANTGDPDNPNRYGNTGASTDSDNPDDLSTRIVREGLIDTYV